MKIAWIGLLCITVNGLLAQPVTPPPSVVFDSEDLPEIHLTIDADSLEELYLQENWYENHEYQTTFIFLSDETNDTLTDVGLRFRGNTSRENVKKSFKISFNTYVPGREFFGLKKLNLNAEVNDPSMLRSRISWDLYRGFGLAASRSNHVKLFINGDYYGLYQNTEHIDAEFVESRFDNGRGNLYKCLYPADLIYSSDNPDDYKASYYGRRAYDLKTNKAWDDYRDLAAFIGFLNNAGDQEFDCRVAEYFDVNSYLKTAAIDVLSGNWDGYIYNKNNYYLYHDILSDRFTYIPYDLDNTYGVDWIGRNWATRNIYNYAATAEWRPLFERLMNSPQYRDLFTYYVSTLLDTAYYTPEHQSAIQNIQVFITPAALSDPYRSLDYGYDDQAFLQALGQAAGGHVDFGVFPFMSQRKSTAQNQLETALIAPAIADVREIFDAWPDTLKVRLYPDGPPSAAAEMNYTQNGVQYTTSGIWDGQAYFFQIALAQIEPLLNYNLTLTGVDGFQRQAFCNSRTVGSDGETPLVINEVMSRNSSTLADENGDFDDWIEIHNFGTQPVNTQGLFLSDNDRALTKWPMPETIIPAGGFILVWADAELHQGPLHANFKVDGDGERIYLTRREPDVLKVINAVTIPALPIDYSYGRATDASEEWMLFSVPTPGASNGAPDGLSEMHEDSNIPFPNPTRDVIRWNRFADFHIADITGRIIASGSGDEFDMSRLSSGVYLLKFDDHVFRIERL